MGNTVLMGTGPGPYKLRIKSWKTQNAGTQNWGFTVYILTHI